MPTESQKRKQTLSILDQLRASGAPGSSRYEEPFSGTPMPESEEEAQDEFEKQKRARLEQQGLNKAEMLPATEAAYGAMTEGVAPGPTGMSPEGMVPYSPEEFERRRQFSPIEKLEQPVSKRKKPVRKQATKRVIESEDDRADRPTSISGGY